MKKSLILTSVLALAACGGGGHGGSSATVNGADSYIRSGAFDSASLESNAKVTGLASAVVVAKDGSSSGVARSATESFGGKQYEVFTLDEVKLYAADSAHTDNGYLQLGMDDDGRIDRVTMIVGGVGDDIARVGETEQFNGPIFEYVPDGGDEAEFRVADTGQDMAALNALAAERHLTGGHWNRVDEIMDIKTYGGSAGLQFSDFGHFNPVYKEKLKGLTGQDSNGDWLANNTSTHTADQVRNELAEEDYQLFAGGYAIKGTTLKDTLDVPKGTSFSGTAIGRVYTSVSADDGVNNDVRTQKAEDAGYYADHDINKAFRTNAATLTIGNDGKQTLYMPFNSKSADANNKFYDVTLVKNANGTMELPTFTGTPTNDKHAIKDASWQQHMVANESSFNPGYYGVNTASEAAGTARLYIEHDLGGGVQREYEVQAAYGMKKN